jgi:hypothetical protein
VDGGEGPCGPDGSAESELLPSEVLMSLVLVLVGVAVAPGLVTEGEDEGAMTLLSMVEPGIKLTPGAADVVLEAMNETPYDGPGIPGAPTLPEEVTVGRAELPTGVEAPYRGADVTLPSGRVMLGKSLAEQMVLVQSTVSYEVIMTVVPGAQS